MVEMTFPPKMERFPLTHWPALAGWNIPYSISDGQGFTGVSVVSPDLTIEYATTGDANIWNLFHSPAYDAEKFKAMLEQAQSFFARDCDLNSQKLSASEKLRARQKLKQEVDEYKQRTSGFRLPPKGFTLEYALELFRMTGDLAP